MPKIEGYWDCAYCGNRAIRGGIRVCPSCGKTRAANTKFYMLDHEPVADESAVETGADWFCPYCDSYNPASATECASCGHPREAEDKDYFQVREDEARKDQEADAAFSALTGTDAGPERPNVTRSRGRRWISLLLILALLLGGIYMLMPRDRQVTVLDKSWERSVEIQENRLVEESDWTMPSDAVELIRSAREIHHYDQVLDHYEPVTVQRSEQVLDGYDTYTTYEDMGNGFFDAVEHQVPRYRTEYYTETYQEPVYVSVPVYDTKYYYTIWRWEYERTETVSGGAEEPYWPEVPLEEDQRKGDREESYAVTVDLGKGKTAEYECDFDIWSAMDPGGSYTVRAYGGQITELK